MTFHHPVRTAAMAITLLAVLLTPAPDKNSLELRPGRYAISVAYAVQEARQNSLREGSRCIVPQDLANPEKIFNDSFTPSPTEEICTVTGLNVGGGRVSYQATCANRAVQVSGTAGREEFAVVRNVRLKTSGSVALQLTVHGKRVGDCFAAARASQHK